MAAGCRLQLRQRGRQHPAQAAEAADQPFGQLRRSFSGERGKELRHDR